MRCRVEYSKAAVRDLDRVWTEVYEASKDYSIAERYIDDLMNKVEAKTDYPESGSPLYYEESFTGYYFVVFKAYMAFYRIRKDVMLVDRVLFGRADYMRQLRLVTKTRHADSM